MEWALVFILSYTDPNASPNDAAISEHATVSSPTYASLDECQAAGNQKMNNLNWSEADGGQLRWTCSQDGTFAQR